MKESRLKKMVDYIIRHETASIKELSNVFDVSIYTIRRDINELAKQGIVKKEYGGVSITQNDNKTLAYTFRNTLFRDDKKDISKQAADLVNRGNVIFIDGGTTTMYMPYFLMDQVITVVTNNIFVMNQLITKQNIEVIMLGGDIRKETNTTCGVVAIDQLKQFNFDQAFISCTGITKSFDLTNYTAIDAELKKIAIQNSKDKYVLVDHSKVGKASLITFGHLSEFTGLITSGHLSKAYKDYCNTQDVKCYEVLE
ncbi:MAG: DeoR/GlpR family DNA-binding transcription regulator [Candidatus Izimaplasma sp.]|nr:DeoR/GlpR family DNA-binding transcription regulator [Candidatus Izimaplasma bacterium]